VKILVVLCHPRKDSLTAQTANSFCNGATQAGHEVELIDLYQEGFDPVLRIEDEPNDGHIENYSQEVQAEFGRLNRNEAIVMIFPLWWWSMPAMLKGWIDRVWNYGLLYDPSEHNLQKGLMIILSANTKKQLKKRSYDSAIETSLNLGILNYCGIKESETIILDGTNLGTDHCAQHLQKAFDKGLSF
jgi:NAD(P)H dehydrogenase (quinone)